MSTIAFQWMYAHDFLTEDFCPADEECGFPPKDTVSFSHRNFQTYCNTITFVGAMIAVLGSKGFFEYPKWKMVIVSDVIVMVGAAMMMEDNFWNIVAGRFFLGVGAGLLTVFVPMSVSGMAPAEYSGPLGMINQIMCCVGILLTAVISAPAPSELQNFHDEDVFWKDEYWRVVLCVPFWASLFQALMIACFFPVDLPSDLKKKGDIENLTKLFSKIYEPKQIAERIQAVNVPKGDANSFGYAEAVTNPKYRKATFIACFMGFAQIATGINAIIQYSGTIFNDLGLKPTTAGIVINCVNLVASILAYPVPIYVGRKTILIVTFGG